MARLALFVLGSFQVTLDGEPVTAFESDKVRALLAYLAVEADRPHRREKLAGLLWPERPEQDARRNLRYALSNLRQTIGASQAIPPFLCISHQAVHFDSSSDAWVDATAFVRLLESPAGAVHELEEAVGLYRGDFLEGFSVGDSVPFEEWALLQQERLHRQALSALHRLAAAYERRGEYERALTYARRQVELEPWQEEAQRQLMRLLAADGQRGAALAQYKACRQALAQELGVEPARATTRLYERIRAGELDLEREIQPAAAEAGSAAILTAGAPALAPHPSVRQRSVKWRWALAGALLLLAAAVALFFAARAGHFEKASFEPLALPSPAGTVLPPAGSMIVDVCDRWRPRSADDETPPQLCIADSHGYHVRAVTDYLEFKAIGRLVWSPDGQQIVFEAEPRRGDHRIYIINADGSNLRRITEGEAPDSVPAWSPDGEWIAFVRRTDLWLVRPDGADAHMLLATGNLPTRGVVWSPDSQRIAFLRAATEAGFLRDEVWAVNRDGSDPRLLHSPERPADTMEVDLAWSPDSVQVGCFFWNEPEGTGLLINADGSGEPQAIEGVPSWWLPDRWPLWGGVK